MKAVMYGGGNIGRGFIGMLFSKSGYKVTFIDVADKVVETLNREGRYPVRIVSNEGYEDIEVTHVDAVNGKDGNHCWGRYYGHGCGSECFKIHRSQSCGRYSQAYADEWEAPQYYHL